MVFVGHILRVTGLLLRGLLLLIGEGQNSPESQETVKASYDAPKVMPPDLWEQLLDECTVLTNCEFGQVRY